MPRGGARQGTPGKAYPQRVDLSTVKPPIAAAPGQAYGKAKEQIDAQKAVPIQAPPPLAPLDRPTDRPDEPLTAGMPIGAGPGPEVLPAFGDDSLTHLRAIFTRFPDPHLRELLEAMEAGEV